MSAICESSSGYDVELTLSADGRYVFVADDSSGLRIVDIQDQLLQHNLVITPRILVCKQPDSLG